MQFETHLGWLASARTEVAATGDLARLQTRDPDAWEQLFERLFPKVYGYALRGTGDRDAAQDIAAETFARAYRDIGRYRERGSSLEAWLFTIAHHRVVDHRRQQRRRAGVELAQAEHLPESEPGLPAEPEAEELLAAIQQLPPEQRAVVLLRFYGKLSGQETAAVLGKTHGAVRALQFRALSSLRQILAEGEQRGASREV
jgi:RNA polymerase sigma-70 factor (ECF subfamily)